MLDVVYNKFTNPPFSENCYVIHNSDAEALIIDPGGRYDEIKSFIKKHNLIPLAILLTHSHPDHMAHAGLFCKEYKIKCYINKNEMEIFDYGEKTWRFITKNSKYYPPKNEELIFFHDNNLFIGKFVVETYTFPGHSPGSSIIKINELIFTGDCLLKDNVGRTDLIGGSKNALRESIKAFPFFNEKFIFLPGHGEQFDLNTLNVNNRFWEIFNS